MCTRGNEYAITFDKLFYTALMADAVNSFNTLPGTEIARRIVFAKGFFDVFLSLSLILLPSLLYDGPIAALISKMTGLSKASSSHDPASAYALASLIMGAAFAGITAGQSLSPDAHKTVATLNGVFAFAALLGCYLSPSWHGSSFLLLAGLQDVFWFYAIVRAGQYGILDTLGLAGSRYMPEAVKRSARMVKEGAGKVKEGGEAVVGGATGVGKGVLDTAGAVGKGTWDTAGNMSSGITDGAANFGTGAVDTTGSIGSGASDATRGLTGNIGDGISQTTGFIGDGVSQSARRVGLN